MTDKLLYDYFNSIPAATNLSKKIEKALTDNRKTSKAQQLVALVEGVCAEITR